MQKVTNRITINYNENEQEETEKVVEFSNRLTELFNRMFTENFKIEINVKQFDEMVELVIKKFLSYDEIQDILRDEKFPMIRYIDYIVSELPEDTNIIFDMERTPKIINYILLAAKYYENDTSKITNFLKENNKEEKEKILDWLKDNARYDLYNYLLQSFIDNIKKYDLTVLDNLEEVILTIRTDAFESFCKQTSIEEKTIQLDKLNEKLFDELLNGFLEYIDAPKEWINKYKYLKENKFIKFKYTEGEENGSCYIDPQDMKLKIKVASDGTIKTFIAFIHEFMHYISLKNGLTQISLLELPSIYYETIATDYLISLGYDEEIMNYIMLRRKENNFGIYRSILPILLDLEEYKNNGLITRKKVIESIKKQNDSLKELSLKLSKMPEINKEQMPGFLKEQIPTFLREQQDIYYGKQADRYCDKQIVKFITTSSTVSIGYQYLIDTMVAEKIRDSEKSDKKNKMIDITENTYKYNLLEVMDYFNIDLKKSEDDKPKIKRM